MPRPERQFTTSAIILKRRDFNEADRLLTILTPTHGKLDVIAKGARKMTSSRTGHVELFTRADMLIHTGRDFGIVGEAHLVEPFLRLREDLQRGAYASYAAELVDRFSSSGEEDHGRAFRLLDAVLEHLCSEEDDIRLAIRYYEMQLLDAAGFRPEMHECLLGREPILAQNQFFSFPEGGIVCPLHAPKAGVLVPISADALKLMRHMQRSKYATVRILKISPALHDEVERIMVGYITFLLERSLQSVDFLRLLRSQTHS